jgi:hypothetical protein
LTGSFELNEVDDLTGIKIIGTFYADLLTEALGEECTNMVVFFVPKPITNNPICNNKPCGTW